MTPGRTIGTYFGLLFLRWFLILFSAALALVFLIDVLEMFRGRGDEVGAAPLVALAVSALRVPAVAEQVVPFAMLVGSIAAFVALSRRLELVSARAAGLSVWQFALPGFVCAFAIGVVTTAAYNPAATAMKGISAALSAERFGNARSVLDQASSPAWLRQRSGDGDSILHVDGIESDGTVVLGPTFWMFDAAGRLVRRVSGDSAELGAGGWVLPVAEVVEAETGPRRVEDYAIPTALTADQVSQRLAAPEDVSFWQLSSRIEQTENAGLPPERFRVHFQTLLARPFLLGAMVLIAATVSLGSSRQGGVGRRILIGVLSGFMLYVALQISGDLGEAGLVPPLVAAWTPALVALLLGTTVLLYREDG